MGQFQGFDAALVRELAGHLDTVAGSMVPMHRQLTQLLQAAADDVAPQPVSASPELEPVTSTLALPTGPPLPLPTVSSVTDFPVELFPSSMSSAALGAGPMPASLDPQLRQTAADIRTRCDRLDQVAKATPLSAVLDAGAQLDTLVDLKAMPPSTAGEGEVAAWWAGLTPAQRDQYLYLKPDVLQTLKGLPTDVVEQAKNLAYFKVQPYKTSSTETKGSVKLSLGIFELGQGFAFRTELMSDGTYRVTMINNAQAGVKLSEEVDDVKLTLSGTVKLEVGDTWVFQSKEEADRLQGDIHQAFLLRQQELAPDMNPMGVATMELQKVLGRIGQPDIQMGMLGTEGNFELKAGRFTSGIKLDGSISTITNKVDEKHPTVTTSYDFKVENTGTAGQAGKFEGVNVTGGTVQVTRDLNNPDPNTNILSVRLIQSVEDKLGTGFEADGKAASASGKGAATNTHVVTLNVPIGNSAADQTAARQWLDGSQSSATEVGSLGTPVVPSGPPPPGADAFTRMAHERGQVSDIQYSGSAADLKLGGKLKFGAVKFGFEATAGNKEEHVTGQRYLSAPDPVTGERHFVPIP